DEQILRRPQLVIQGREPIPVLRLQDALGPLDGLARNRIEVVEPEAFDGGDVVISQHGGSRTLANERDAFVGIGSVAHDVAKAEHSVLRLEHTEGDPQRFEVAVNVRDDGISHAGAGSASAASTAASAWAKTM